MAKIPHNIDKRIGENVRQIRLMRSLSQEKLGDGLGLTFQQVQKYEKGTNRISGSRIVQMAHILEVGIIDLFQGIDINNVKPTRSGLHDFVAIDGATALVKDVLALEPDYRKQALEMCRAIVKTLSNYQ